MQSVQVQSIFIYLSCPTIGIQTENAISDNVIITSSLFSLDNSLYLMRSRSLVIDVEVSAFSEYLFQKVYSNSRIVRERKYQADRWWQPLSNSVRIVRARNDHWSANVTLKNNQGSAVSVTFHQVKPGTRSSVGKTQQLRCACQVSDCNRQSLNTNYSDVIFVQREPGYLSSVSYHLHVWPEYTHSRKHTDR